jgi:hypothetical protein
MPSKAKSKPTWESLRNAPDYRRFLQTYLDESSRSLSDFARAAGFGRGFPGDVISGRRRLTAKSFVAFERALDLPVDGRKLFRYLVAEEVPEILPGIEISAIRLRIASLRQKSWTRVRSKEASSNSHLGPSVFANPDTFAVYAAAGTVERGAAFPVISKRTGLSDARLSVAVEGLVRASLLNVADGICTPQDTHVFLKTAGNDRAFSDLFKTISAQAAARVDEKLKSDEELFFTSSFCVAKKRLPELKRALRRTLLQFVDEAIESEGDQVVLLETALFQPGS